jgi:hypothetical protein
LEEVPIKTLGTITVFDKEGNFKDVVSLCPKCFEYYGNRPGLFEDHREFRSKMMVLGYVKEG